MEKAIKSLEEKLENFIGVSSTPIKTAEARGFKSGLSWAIDTLKTIKYQEELEEENKHKGYEIYSSGLVSSKSNS